MSIKVTVLSEVSALNWCGCFLTTVPQESFSGLKPSTLKQLGQTVPTTTAKQVNTRTHIETNTHTLLVSGPIFLTWCMSFRRILLALQMVVSLCLHWLMGEWTSCQSPLSNSTPFPALSVHCYSLCNVHLYLDFPYVLICGLILAILYSLRIWDCLQRAEGVGVRICPVTICTRTDTNLQCALNVAVSWPRRTPRDQRWKLASSRFFSSDSTVGFQLHRLPLDPLCES